MLTPEQRSQRATIAALTRWSKESGAAQAAAGQDGLLRKFEREVDPDGVLPEAERRRRAICARRAHMTKLAFRSSKVRADWRDQMKRSRERIRPANGDPDAIAS